MRCIQLLFVAFGALPVYETQAFSTGVGSCPKGVSGAGGDHLDFGPGSPSGREGSSGSLSDGATVLTIADTVMVPGTEVSFPVNTDLVWSVEAFEVSFRGILMRAEGEESNTFTLTADNPLLVNAVVCAGEPGNIIGINHSEPSDKVIETGILRFDATGPVTLDITVVYRNGRVEPNNVSSYAFSAYTFNIVAAAPTPVTEPAPAPVSVPVETPVEVPVETPAEVPVEAPVEIPVEAPVDFPVEMPWAPEDKIKGKGKGKSKGEDKGKGKSKGKDDQNSNKGKGKSNKGMGKGKNQG